MFHINSAQDRGTRNFSLTGVINLNNIYMSCDLLADIFQYLKNLCKTKIGSHREES